MHANEYGTLIAEHARRSGERTAPLAVCSSVDLLSVCPNTVRHPGEQQCGSRHAILILEYDDTDQIHDETARQSRSAFGIGLSIAL